MKNLKLYEGFGDISEGLSSEVYIVTAQAFNPQTGEPEGESRDEEINVKTNQLFKGCKSILDIHDKYCDFWNHMNSNPSALVFVSKITPKKK